MLRPERTIAKERYVDPYPDVRIPSAMSDVHLTLNVEGTTMTIGESKFNQKK